MRLKQMKRTVEEFCPDCTRNVVKLKMHCIVFSKKLFTNGRGVMVRAWSFVNATACRAISNPAWCMIFRGILCFTLSTLGHYFDVVSVGKALPPQMFHLTQVEMSTW